MIIAYMIMLNGFMLFPVILYYFDSTKLAPIAPMCLPWTTLDDYAINIIFQIVSVFYGFIAHTFFDTIFLFQILHVILLTAILRAKIRRMAAMMGKGPSDFKLKIILRNIIQLHIENLGYGIILKTCIEIR